MTASQQPDAEHAPLTSPAAGGSGPTGHDKAVAAVMQASDCSRAVDVNGNPYCEAHWYGWLRDVDACPKAERIAQEVVAALRAALVAGDADVAGPVAEALGLHRRVMWDDNRSDRKGEAIWFQTTPVWTWTEAP